MSSVCGPDLRIHADDFKTVKKTRKTIDTLVGFISKASHIILGLRSLEAKLLERLTPLQAYRVVLGVLNTMHMQATDESQMDRIQIERLNYLKKIKKVEQEPLIRPIREALRGLVFRAGEISCEAVSALTSAEFMGSLDRFHPQHEARLRGLMPFAFEERFRAIYIEREVLALRSRELGVDFLELLAEEVGFWCDAHPDAIGFRFDLVGQQAFMFSRMAEFIPKFPEADRDLLAIALTASLEGMDPPSFEKVDLEVKKYESRLPKIKEELAKEEASLESVLAILKASS